MRSIVLLFHFSLLTLLAFGQRDSIPANSIQLDIGGMGGYGSLNYERSINVNSKFRIRPRIGISFLRIKDFHNRFNPDLSVPISINLTYGAIHMAEIGVGNSYTNVVQAGSDFQPKRISNMHGAAHFGYRYQKPTGGILLRCGYAPLFEYYKSIRHWGVITIGWAF